MLLKVSVSLRYSELAREPSITKPSQKRRHKGPKNPNAKPHGSLVCSVHPSLSYTLGVYGHSMSYGTCMQQAMIAIENKMLCNVANTFQF